jgi:hypothetical protein
MTAVKTFMSAGHVFWKTALINKQPTNTLITYIVRQPSVSAAAQLRVSDLPNEANECTKFADSHELELGKFIVLFSVLNWLNNQYMLEI